MPTNDPATKQDLREQEDRLQGGIHQTEERILAKMQAQGDRLVEKMRDMQTEVLRAFHDWARTMETRLRGVASPRRTAVYPGRPRQQD